MQDRVPLYPGRVTLTPVEGQPNTYDMVRADHPTQTGTPLSKANLLKDTTAAQFGLGSEAVPDDVLSWVGKYNEYWWSLLHGQASVRYDETRTLISNAVKVADGDGNGEIYYSDEISIDQSTGNVSLVNQQTLTFNKKDAKDTNEANLKSLYNKYISNFWNGSDTYVTSKIAYVPDGAQYLAAEEFVGYSKFKENQCYLVTSTAVNVPAGETTYEHSTNRNAYPDSGTVDEITYTYLGKPFEKFPTTPQIETGSYTGTGTYGSSNPNSLTFGFVPKLVFVCKETNAMFHSYSSTLQNWFILLNGVSTILVKQSSNNSGTTTANITWDDKTVSWYSTWAGGQLNAANATYLYIAIS